MKAQYQQYTGNNTHTVVSNETLNNILLLGGLNERSTISHVQKVAEHFFPQPRLCNALDLGAGRGLATMVLAGLGFQVKALNLHRSYLPIVQKLALSQELNVSFGLGRVEQVNEKFDMIHDRECLTQITNAEERKTFLAGVQKALAVNGKFVLTTAAMSENFVPAESFESIRLDNESVLWRQTPACDIAGVVEQDGKFWTAQKKVAPVEVLRAELKAAGFMILAEELEIMPGNQPAALKLVLTSIGGC